MKKKALLPLFLGIMVFLAGCDYSKPEKRSGFFYNTFVDPMKNVLDWLGNNLLNDNYYSCIGNSYYFITIHVVKL